MQSAFYTSSKQKHHETEQTWLPGRTDIFLDDEISPRLPVFDPQPAVY